MTDSNKRSEPDFAAFIGIDWADQRHAWAHQTTTHGVRERGDLDSRRQGRRSCFQALPFAELSDVTDPSRH
jgi:hypothetical protein